MMNKQQLHTIINKLNLPKGEWAIFGGACLTAREIRSTTDLEIFVTSRLYEVLMTKGWMEKTARSTGARYVAMVVNDIPVLAFITCGSELWRPNAKQYIEHPEFVDGLPTMPLTELYKWKAVTRRTKDVADLILIDAYLKHENTPAYENRGTF